MRTKRQLSEEQVFLLEAAFGRLEAAQRGLDQAKAELGRVMRAGGLSASARHLEMSKQWALQLAQKAEKGSADEGIADLAESIRRLGVLEPITAETVGDGELLLVTDGRRRLQAAREAGMTSLPVMLLLTGGPSPAGTRRLQALKDQIGSPESEARTPAGQSLE